MRIDACYDSHVHWPATGEYAQRLKLDSLSAPEEILNLRSESQHLRGEWLLGFGWDDNLWKTKAHKSILDQWAPNIPVALTRCDAHAIWANTEALKRVGIFKGSIPDIPGGRVEVDKSGEPTGILVDKASYLIREAIPQLTPFEMRRQLLQGVKIFNDAGFTHIRDMTCDENQWNEATHIDQSGLLTMAVEEYFRLNHAHELDSVLSLVGKARASQTANLRAQGIKIFLDGALGSEGAWLSRCYCGREHKGLQLWDEAAVREVLIKTWEKGFHLAAHAIGDEAADWIINIARSIKDSGGPTGPLHIEHGELIRGETVQKMKDLQVEVHIQPCHWLSDQRWLKDKIGDLVSDAFPWRRLQESEVPFDFGSDAPIEPASLGRTFQALRQSAEAGIPRLLGLPNTYMGHKDHAWAPNSYTVLEEEAPVQVVFRGEHLL